MMQRSALRGGIGLSLLWGDRVIVCVCLWAWGVVMGWDGYGLLWVGGWGVGFYVYEGGEGLLSGDQA